jgi:hypothetical protein
MVEKGLASSRSIQEARIAWKGLFGSGSQEAVMDAGVAVKPVASVVTNHAAPAVALAPAAPAELPGSKTVKPSPIIPPARNETRHSAPVADSTQRDAIIDPQTREVVFRLLDARTRQVLHQVPDQALLRAQAYARAQAAQDLADGKNPLSHSDHVDSIT